MTGGAGEEIFGGGVGLGLEPGREKQRLERLAHRLVIIDDMYKRPALSVHILRTTP